MKSGDFFLSCLPRFRCDDLRHKDRVTTVHETSFLLLSCNGVEKRDPSPHRLERNRKEAK